MRERDASRFSEAFEFKSWPGTEISDIIGGEKVKRTHLSIWRRIYKYFNYVLHNFIKYIHNCNHWLPYFKLHNILCNIVGQWKLLWVVGSGNHTSPVPTTPACTWWNRPEDDPSSGKLELTHPSRTSVKSDKDFWCWVSHACQRWCITYPSCYYVDIRNFEWFDDGPDHGKQQRPSRPLA